MQDAARRTASLLADEVDKVQKVCSCSSLAWIHMWLLGTAPFWLLIGNVSVCVRVCLGAVITHGPSVPARFAAAVNSFLTVEVCEALAGTHYIDVRLS